MARSTDEGERRPLVLVCHDRYQRQRNAARGRVMLSLPERGPAAGPAQFHALAELRHPNILPIYTWGAENGAAYIVTPPPPADSLADALGTQRLRRNASIGLLRAIAIALDFAHSRDVVHGCLEPAAVLLAPDGRPLVADFGLATLVDAAPPPAGVCFYDAAYVAPERVLGHQASCAADIYAFSAIAYEVLTGEAPFADAASVDQVYAHVDREPVRPSAHNEAINGVADEVIMSGLARNPNLRWPSCVAMMRALEWSLIGPPALPQPPAVPAERVPQPAPVPAPAQPPPERREPIRVTVGAAPVKRARPAPRRKRHRIAKTIGVLALSVVSAGVGALLVPGGNLPGERSVLGLPGVRQQLPPVIAQRLAPTNPPAAAVAAAPTIAPSVVASAPAQATPTPAAGGAPAPAQATPAPGSAQAIAITLNPTKQARGGVVNVTGTGFNPAGQYLINLSQGGTDFEVQPATKVPANGIFSVSVIVPGQASPGAATISACTVSANGATGACVQQPITLT